MMSLSLLQRSGRLYFSTSSLNALLRPRRLTAYKTSLSSFSSRLIHKSSWNSPRLKYLSTQANFNSPANPLSTFQTNDSVQIEWSEGKKSTFDNFWLRDSCQCSQCFNADTSQRLFDTASLSTDIKPSRVTIDDDDSLKIHWEDGHESKYSFSWLHKNDYHPDGFPIQPSASRKLVAWGSEISENLPTVGYNVIMDEDKGVLDMYDKMERYGFCLVEGTPIEPSATEDLINRFAMIRHTFYGGFCVLEPNMEIKDTAYTNLAIEPHTDANYFQDPPGLLLFHVIKFEGSGTCYNYLVDGQKLSQTIKEENPIHYQILCNVPLSYHYTDEHHCYLNSHIPFTIDKKTGELSELHFNNHDRLPLGLTTLECLEKINQAWSLTDVHKAIQTFLKTMRRDELQYKLCLEPGTALVLNNHRLMHARSSFSGKRVLIGTYMNMEDFKSTVMSLKAKLSL